MNTCLKDLGVICSLGNNKQDVFNGLVSANNFLSLDSELPIEDPQLVGRVAMPDIDYLDEISTRNNQLAYLAFLQIEKTLAPLFEKYGADRIAVVIGTSTASIFEGEQARKQLSKKGEFPENYRYEIQEMSAPATYVATLSGAKGPVFGISTACSSSGKALASAKNLLATGLADVVIAGGVDSLTQLTTNGFKSLESIAKTQCKPFSSDRDGINIGEAAALFIITKEAGGIQFLGAGETSDAYHISAPSPEGEGASNAMALALKNANLKGEEVDYVNLHGTGTPKNDEMEAKAMFNVCGEQVTCGSTKHLTGHTLGAAGALEIGLCWLLMSDYNPHCKTPSNYQSQCADHGLPKIKLSTGEAMNKIQYCMSNSFAFGGNNFSAVIGKKNG